MDKDKTLEEIFSNDPLGLLNVKPKSSSVRTADERLQASFDEINHYVDKNGSPPKPNVANISEYQLYSRLKSICNDPEKVALLKESDRYKLLPETLISEVQDQREVYQEPKEIKSIEDIFSNDSLDILSKDDEGLFNFRHTPKETVMPEYVGSRKPCEDFDQFEEMLRHCQKDLRLGKRKLMDFRNEQQIDKGYFFVLNGVLLYVAEIGKRKTDKKGKMNTRLRCIFENGTESDMLLRSLAAELYKNGRRVTEHEDKLLQSFQPITEEDEAAGFIYVLKSKSKDERIQSIPNLFKIGYSRTEVPERIRNAEKEPTYLMAPVDYIAGWQCFNMNPQKFEQMIHNFFGSACLEIDVFGENGKRHTPREWFIAPIEVIEQAIELIINGKIINYRYDPERQTIVGR